MGKRAGFSARETMLLRVGLVFDAFELTVPKERQEVD